MGLVWRRTELAIALVLAGAVACSGPSQGAQQQPVGAGSGGGGAGGAYEAPDATDATDATAGAGGMPDSAVAIDASRPPDGSAEIDAGRDAEPIDAEIIEPIDESCLAGLSHYEDRGPFAFEATDWDLDPGTIRAYVPDVPAGCRVPIVHFANGTGATCASYQSTLEHLASFGFVALCFESTNTAAGTQCMEAVTLAYEKLPELVSDKVGLAGHEFGGLGALICTYRAEEAWGASRVLTTYALSPTHGSGGTGDVSWTEAYPSIETPILMLNTEGGLVSESWVGEAFDYLPEATEAYQYKAVGATDLPVPYAPMNESIVAWLRWKLLGERAACEHFKAMPDTTEWELVKATSPSSCE